MQAHDYAFGSMDLLAPAPFRAALKRAFPDAHGFKLDCWFHPRSVHYRFGKTGRVAVPGCWVIWQQVTEHFVFDLGHGVRVSAPRRVWMDAYKLDGEFGLPTSPGEWTIKVLLDSDMKRECNRFRNTYLDNLNASDVLEQYKRDRALHEDILKDKLWKRMIQINDDARGKEVLSGDEKKAWSKMFAEQDRKELAAVEKRAKEVQFKTKKR